MEFKDVIIEEKNDIVSVSGVEEGKTQSSPAYSASTTVSSLQELKEIAPDIYQKTLEGIAFHITCEMKHHQDRLKEMQREGRNI